MKYLIQLLFCILSLDSYSQWVPSQYPINFTSFSQVDYINEDTLWGTEFNGIVASFDGGETFVRQNNIQLISCVNAFHINQNLYFVNNGLFESINLGLNWNRKQIVNNLGDTIYKGNLYQAHIFSNDKGFALGAGSNGKYKLFTTINRGEFWQEEDSSLVNIPNYGQGISSIFPGTIHCFDSNCIAWNNREKNKFWVFNNYGQNVKEIDLNSKINSDIRSFAFSDFNNGIFITIDGSVYRTENEFSNIAKVGNAPTVLTLDFGKSDNPKNSFYILGGTSGTGSYYSQDSGATWQTLGDVYSHFFIKMFNSSVGITSVNSSIEPKIKTFDYFVTDIEEVKKINQITVYPNPVNKLINVSCKTQIKIENLKIYSSTGQCIMQQENINPIDVELLKSGIYYIHLSTEKGLLVTKFIKL